MDTITFTKGERVAGIYFKSGAGTVLDYTGVVEAVEPCGHGDFLTIQYASGRVEKTTSHPDWVFSMESAYRFAARFLADAPGAEISTESFEAVAASWATRPDFWDARRALWVLTYAREAIQ